MVNKQIALIGAGQIGSRHLQGLASASTSIDLSVVDPSSESLLLAEKRYREMPSNSHIQSVQFFQSIQSLKIDLDIVIIATNANVRRQVIEELLGTIRVRYMIVEKVAFQSIEDFEYVMGLTESMGVKVWVNCPRRIYPYYQSVKQEIVSGSPLSMSVTGGDWGMASNCIHILDVFNFLNDDQDLVCIYSNLDNEEYFSKREGYLEVCGELLFAGKNGSRLFVQFKPDSDQPLITHLESDQARYIIDEFNTTMISSLKRDAWSAKSHEICQPLQSELTGELVDTLLQSGCCGLPTLASSFLSHKAMLAPLKDHFNIRSESVNIT